MDKKNDKRNKRRSRIEAVALAALLLTGCASGPAVWRDPGAEIPGLPPDPGPGGQATLIGRDADHDGLRDDVQRWLALQQFGPVTTRVLAELARSFQTMLVHSTEKKVVHEAADHYALYTVCLFKFDGALRGQELAEQLEHLMLNTAERRSAHANAKGYLHEFYGRVHDGSRCEQLALAAAQGMVATR